jgi:hypothetical protein
MLNQIEDRLVSTRGHRESNTFTIKANGKAFKTLIDGLYSNKVRAVIRELCTNAHDSHVEAGHADRQFAVQLPTEWDPQFAVRDYGVSLSHDDVMHLYTTVFESTKEDRDDQTGKLGLGSKSPFAYTDAFTVTAWRDGRCRAYSAYIGDRYMPEIALLSDEPSDEPQGLEVAFAVQAADIYTFATEAATVALGLSVQPVGRGPAWPAPDSPDLLATSGWRINTAYSGPHARQGSVAYPLDLSAVRNLPAEVSGFRWTPICIDFPMDSLEIVASREGLGYDTRTSANIVRRLQEVLADLRTMIDAQLSTATTYWGACILLRDFRDKYKVPNDVVKAASEDLWRGRGFQMTWNVNKRDIRAHRIEYYPNGVGRRDGRRGVASRAERAHFHYGLEEETPPVIYFVRGAKGREAQNNIRRRIFEHAARGTDRRSEWIIFSDSESTPLRLAAALGRPDWYAGSIIRASDLPMTPKERTQRANRSATEFRVVGQAPAYSWRDSKTESWSKIWTKTEYADFDEPALYIVSDRNDLFADAAGMHKRVHADVAADFAAFARGLGLQVYVVPRRQINEKRRTQFAEAGWASMQEWVDRYFAANAPDMPDDTKAYHALREIEDLPFYAAALAAIWGSGPLRDAADWIANLQVASDRYKANETLYGKARRFGYQMPASTREWMHGAFSAAIYGKYPLIRHFNHGTSEMGPWLEYVAMIDAKLGA